MMTRACNNVEGCAKYECEISGLENILVPSQKTSKTAKCIDHAATGRLQNCKIRQKNSKLSFIFGWWYWHLL